MDQSDWKRRLVLFSNEEEEKIHSESEKMLRNEIQCLIDDLIDRVVAKERAKEEFISMSRKTSIDEKFSSSLQIFHRSMKKLFQLELEILVHNGSMNLAPISNRQTRYSHPTTTSMKQMSELKKKLRWINLRKTFLQQIDSTKSTDEQILTTSNLDQCENLWFERRLNMLNNSIEVLKENFPEKTFVENPEISSRTEIFRRDQFSIRPMKKTIDEIFRRTKFNRSNFSFSSDLINDCAKLADRIGLSPSTLTNSNLSKKIPSTVQKKKSTLMKIPSNLSGTGGENQRKRSLEENRTTISTHFDSKRQKRIASPSSSSNNLQQTNSSNEILIPTWRILTSNDFESTSTNSTEEIEDISDEIYLRRHIRCEFEQETWIHSTQQQNSSTTNRKCLQTSISLPSGLSSTTTTTKSRDRLTSNHFIDQN